MAWEGSRGLASGGEPGWASAGLRGQGRRRCGRSCGEGRGSGGGGANSRTPAGRLLGQLQPVDGQAVGATAHAGPLALALHVALCLAHVCRLDLVPAVALSAELQPGIQVTPRGRLLSGHLADHGDRETHKAWRPGGSEGSGDQDPQGPPT